MPDNPKSAQISAETRARILESALGREDSVELDCTVRRALDLLKNGSFRDAFLFADRAARIEPSKPELWLLKGLCLQNLQHFEDALSCFWEAKTLAPDFVPALRAIVLLAKYTPSVPKPLVAQLTRQIDTLQATKQENTKHTKATPSAATKNKYQTPCLDNKIDVIIPVYKNYELTRACIASVLANQKASLTEVVVVDDASPDPLISQWLDSLAKLSLITLLKNETNLGFIKTVNRALDLHPWRDVILLNSDTEVNGNWAARLHTTAYKQQNIATVTPLSNNGEHFGYPSPFQVYPMPHGLDLAKIDEAARISNNGQTIEVPFGIGYCLYIKRKCLDDIGYLDDDSLIRGYGEEVDFCLRASANGWKHACALDTFVAHKGNASFGNEKAFLVKNNNYLIRSKHPNARATYADFIKRDPIKPYRLGIELQLHKDLHESATLIALKPGLTESEVIHECRELIIKKEPFFILTFSEEKLDHFHIKSLKVNGLKNLTYNLPDDLEALIIDLQKIKIKKVICKHPSITKFSVFKTIVKRLNIDICIEEKNQDISFINGLDNVSNRYIIKLHRKANATQHNNKPNVASIFIPSINTAAQLQNTLSLARTAAKTRSNVYFFTVGSTPNNLSLFHTNKFWVFPYIGKHENTDLLRKLLNVQGILEWHDSKETHWKTILNETNEVSATLKIFPKKFLNALTDEKLFQFSLNRTNPEDILRKIEKLIF